MAFLMGSAAAVILYFAFPLLHKNLDRNSFFWLSFCGSGLSLTVIGFWWRVLRLKHIAASGQITEGTIDYIQYVKDRGRVEYSFTVEGQPFNSWCPVHLSSEVLSLDQGQKVRIVFNPKNPSQSFIAELFLEGA
jgi:hypothetical protein